VLPAVPQQRLCERHVVLQQVRESAQNKTDGNLSTL
jgi:hypothetical protein